jgi:hypothetical protein
MGLQIYNAFDPTFIGSHLGLSNANQQLAPQASSATVDNLRIARSLYPAWQPSNVEFLIYSPDATTPALTSKACMIGLCTSQASLANYLGGDANGWGWSPGDGWLYFNNAQVQFMGTATYGDFIMLEVDPNQLLLTIFKTNKLGTVQLGQAFVLPSNKAFLYGATISGTSTGMNLLSNSGLVPFFKPIGGLTGWWVPRLTPNPVYIATEPFISLPTDTLAHQKFLGDLDGGPSEATGARFADVFPWGQSKPMGSGGSTISFDLLDPYRVYESQLSIAMRDLPVTMSRIVQQGSLNSAESVFSAIIDKVEQTGDQTKRYTLKDKLAQIQAALTRPVFPPTVEPAVAGKTRAMALGICRDYVPDLYDGVNFFYGCSDAALSAFGITRFQGVPQVYGGSYVVTSDGAGIQLITNGTPTAPAGKITVESTSYAGAFSVTANDYFNSLGLFESLAIAGQPTMPTIQCYPPWAQSTYYGVGSSVVSNGNWYTCSTSGTSLNSGTGPTGTGTPISDGTAVWYYVGVAATKGVYTAWKAGAVVATNSYCYNGNNTYKCTVGGTSAGSGGPTGTATSGIVDNTAQWGYVGIFSAGHQPASPSGANPTLQGTAPNKYVDFSGSQADALQWMFTNHPSYFVTPGRSYAYSIKVLSSATPSGPGVDPTSGQPIAITPPRIHLNWRGSQFATLTSFNVDQNGPAGTTVATYTGAFTFGQVARGTGPFPLYLALENGNIIGGPDTLIQEFILQLLPDVGQSSTLAGPGLDTMLRNLLLSPRGPFTLADYDPTGAQAIDANGSLAGAPTVANGSGYQWGLYVAAGATDTIQACVKKLLDSICACLYLGRDGKIRIFQLFAPEAAGVTVKGSLGITDFESELIRYPDNAENLTPRHAGARIISPCTDADFANITESQCSSAQRAILKQDFTWTVTGGSQLGPNYVHANIADPLPSCLDLQANGQTEANRLTAIYSVMRNFYAVEVATPIGRTLDIGDVWNVKYPNGSLVNGQNLLVVGLVEKPTSQTSTVYFWGL